MVEYRNECLSCASQSFPCRGKLCELRNVPVYMCDLCGEELVEDEPAYEYGGEMYHDECVLKILEERGIVRKFYINQ